MTSCHHGSLRQGLPSLVKGAGFRSQYILFRRFKSCSLHLLDNRRTESHTLVYFSVDLEYSKGQISMLSFQSRDYQNYTPTCKLFLKKRVKAPPDRGSGKVGLRQASRLVSLLLARFDRESAYASSQSTHDVRGTIQQPNSGEPDLLEVPTKLQIP